jgi:NAD(P)H dehydrogenase (quinone)
VEERQLNYKPGGTMSVHAAVIYYSATGNVYSLARAVVTGAEKAGAETRLRKVHELAPDEAVATNEGWRDHALETQSIEEADLADLEWADAVIFGTPTRFGNVAAQLKQFMDTTGPLWAAGKLANKAYAGFVSTATAHGGQETTLLAMANTFYHWGGIIVAPGYLDPVQYSAGNPYGASHISANGANLPNEIDLAAAEFTGRRCVEVATALRAGGIGGS